MRRVSSLAVLLSACSGKAPPGGEAPPRPSAVVVSAASAETSSAAVASAKPDVGGVDDSLPFSPGEDRVASIAWRTWVYTDTGPKRTRFGYLRAGAIVPRRGPEIRNDGCPGGWWRVNPRGFVCVGRGATLELGNPVVVAADVRPKRGESLPYVYAMAKDPGPHFYFRLPSEKEMLTVEGPGYAGRSLEWRERLKRDAVLQALVGPLGDPPEFVPTAEGKSLTKPYGTEQGLHRSVQSGQSDPDAGFAISRLFDWKGRTFGLTTELDLIPLDRTSIVKPSTFHGVVLGEGEDLPVAIVTKQWALRYVERKPGLLAPVGTFAFREGIKLTGRTVPFEGVKFWEGVQEGRTVPDGGAPEHVFVAPSSALVIEKRKGYPSVASGNRKWIDVSIRDQSLVAYEGEKAVYVTLVSTGLAGLADPEKAPATVRGTYMIHTKHVSSTMDGDEDVSDSYSLRDVPFVQYFHKGYALHAAYWHDQFGKVRSHGCINLAPRDAAWLFEWTDPQVPEGWHGVINKERGTAIVIHP
ncbi:MAG TPA: L,D-transpeptidase [Polyangiaceae bacterium]|nr:L,D-transpeptidase [Polyangiaceae bacterium]